jgi:hypothetical protein
MSYSIQKLTDELQKAVAMRGTKQQTSAPNTALPKGRFEISPEVTDYLRKMRTYREQSRTVRIGRY